MTKDSQILDDVRFSGDENSGMHMAVSRGSDAIGTVGRGPEHVAEGGLALAVGISHTSVQNIWREHSLKPHLADTFKVSNDPAFAEKVADVVGLYLDP